MWWLALLGGLLAVGIEESVEYVHTIWFAISVIGGLLVYVIYLLVTLNLEGMP